MKRPDLPLPVPLLAAGGALLLLTGVAAVTVPGGSEGSAAPPARLPVERSSVLCPQPGSSDLAETTYTSFTPEVKGAGKDGKAELLPAAPGREEAADRDKEREDDRDKERGDDRDKEREGDRDKDGKTPRDGDKDAAEDSAGAEWPAPGAESVLSPKKPGAPVEYRVNGADKPALVGTAAGSLAPGWTVQQTTEVAAGTGRGLQGLACQAPDTDFWFPGVSTSRSRSDYVHLVNPDDSTAVVDIELHGPKGAMEESFVDDIAVPPHSTEKVLLSTLTEEIAEDVTAHVTARTGRVSAAVQALDDKTGGDWLPPAADPAGSLVLPGIPKDATSVRLVAYGGGEDDADLKLRLALPTGSITPAGHEILHLKSGMTSAADLKNLTRGEPGSLVLTPDGSSVPVVAALKVTRGKGDDRETAWIPASPALSGRAVASGNPDKGATLALTAPRGAATVEVTASAGTDGGTPSTKTYQVKAGATLSVTPPRPKGLKGTYALTVRRVSGGAVHASRMLQRSEDGVPMFTVQTLADDRGTVAVPEAKPDLEVVQK